MSTIDLSTVAAPDVVEALDYETILAAAKVKLIELAPELEAVLSLESEPSVKLLELEAYREVIVRARVNDGARAVMLPTSTGADLDNLAALFNVERLIVTPADPDAVPPVEAVMESDDRLRARMQMAFEGLSVAGPKGAYEFQALSASADVLDVGVSSPAPGEVWVTILAQTVPGEASQALLDTVSDALNAEDVRPLCDTVVVQSAAITQYSIIADITVLSGPSNAVVLSAAQTAAETMAESYRRIGQPVPLSAIYAALHQGGVRAVVLTSPVADVDPGTTGAAYCSTISLTLTEVDDE